MSLYSINPNTWTLIGSGSCVVTSQSTTELIRFKLGNGKGTSSYLNKQLLITNEGDLFAKSTSRNIQLTSVAADSNETSASIKEKYEANANTNAYTDGDKLKIDSLVISDGEVGFTPDTPESIKAKYESNADTNAFTDADKTKLTGIPAAGIKGDQGAPGPKGDPGVKGADSTVPGPRGVKGDTGAAGTNINIVNHRTGTPVKIWVGTQAEYSAVTTKDSATLYMVR